MKKIIIVSISLFVLFSGCSTIPKNASILNAKVSEGIKRNQIETEKIITALGDIQRAILDEEWDNIYAKTEKKYLSSHSISDPTTLTQQDRNAIAVNASEAYNNLLNEISEREKAIKQQTRQNTEILIEINDEISYYLLSLERLDAARSNVTQLLDNIIGIQISIFFKKKEND